eukprot:34154_1
MANKDPQCLIIVEVKGADDLPKRDKASKSDPYCKVKINQDKSDNKESKENLMQTQIIFNQQDNIKWNAKARFCVFNCNTEIVFEVRDDDDYNYDQVSTKSEPIGYYVHLLNEKDFNGEEQELKQTFLRKPLEKAREAAAKNESSKKTDNVKNSDGKDSTISISITAYKLLTEDKIDEIEETETAMKKRIKQYEKEMKDKDATISNYAITIAKLKQQINDAARILKPEQYK